MTTATKTPPMIAPGVICPKCKGPMLDERATKRTEKSPDYTCANMLCTSTDGKYRTAIWIKDVVGVVPGDAVAPANGKLPVSQEGEKPRLDRLYLRATRLVLDEVVPLYVKAGIGCSDTAVAAMAATLFIAGSKEL